MSDTMIQSFPNFPVDKARQNKPPNDVNASPIEYLEKAHQE